MNVNKTSKKTISICPYCKEEKEIVKSHAIPLAIFNFVLRQEKGGQLIHLNDDERKVGKSQDTGAKELLCKDCESDFNQRFDKKFVKTIKDWVDEFIKNGGDAQYTCNPNHLARSIVSIFWRACLIKNDFYSRAEIGRHCEDKLLAIIKDDSVSPLDYCSIRVERIYDRDYNVHSHKKGLFSPKACTEITMSVCVDEIIMGTNQPYCSLTAIMLGFVFDLLIYTLPNNELNKIGHNSLQNKGYISAESSLIKIPLVHILDYEPSRELIINSIKKIKEGHTTLKN